MSYTSQILGQSYINKSKKYLYILYLLGFKPIIYYLDFFIFYGNNLIKEKIK